MNNEILLEPAFEGLKILNGQTINISNENMAILEKKIKILKKKQIHNRPI